LKGKVCLVTGASRGIGAAIASALAERGARVVVHYGHAKELAVKVAENLAGSDHLVVGANLANPDAADENAGIFVPHPPMTVDADDWLFKWEQTLAVNLLSPAALCQSAAKIMAEQGGGRIINIGSRGAFRGEPECPAYAASKAGLHAMSQSLAVALAPHGILVYAVAPGFVATDMAQELLDSEKGAGIRAQSPLGRVAIPEEIAETVCFLASSRAEFLSGGIIDINGASYLRS